MAGPSKELLDSIAHLPESTRLQVLEAAWRQEAIEAVQRGETPEAAPWHTRFKIGNKVGKINKGRTTIKRTLRALLKKKDGQGRTIAEELLLAAIGHAIEGNANFFGKLCEVEGSAASENDKGGPSEVTIRLRPAPALVAEAEAHEAANQLEKEKSNALDES